MSNSEKPPWKKGANKLNVIYQTTIQALYSLYYKYVYIRDESQRGND